MSRALGEELQQSCINRKMREDFIDTLENSLGLFTRKYAGGDDLLWEAASLISKHLSNLDGDNTNKAARVTITDLANAYRYTCLTCLRHHYANEPERSEDE